MPMEKEQPTDDFQVARRPRELCEGAGGTQKGSRDGFPVTLTPGGG